jgi:hypothetical protein
MLETQKERLFLPASQTTLVDIHHPTFLEGYQEGRHRYFQDPEILTDKQVVEMLAFIFERDIVEEVIEDTKAQEQDLYFCIGQLLGKISGPFVPLQPHEEQSLAMQQEHFLVKVSRGYGEQGQALSESIQQLWQVHDQLARTLDADDFDQVLCRGREKVVLL